ncbi:MAG TPA: 16S rRNA (adenine(1518)-N(6)/adenine(1519)-N(6))-dimethyltransferase RsmA [Candidatus Methylacidiphilales bacterium]|jgi:16S rRNA (adenine1518-N6/adenine1519-N6)-dimethyltransferase|nr:16S rRNA (adenine(1518)-N(6)/adenine(1519)-N(6))-dimethyltransferase RsmA [Candidatus Methylacidiphilales bacterium]
MTLTEIRAALDTRGLRPLKQLGQNFLHDQNLAKWLADHAAAGMGEGAAVVEIGPGLGALTEWLLAKKLHVIALEKDRGLCVFLRERFAGEIAEGKFDLREGDALDLLPQLGLAPAVICGNLPYYISTPLLMECLKLPGAPARLFFLVQKEVGQRLASAPGSKVYGSLSVLVQTGYEVQMARTLPGSVFYPPPEVESVAVQLTPRAQPLVAPQERASFAAVVQRGFSQRRKKLSNLLEIREDRRAEALSPVEWVELWRRITSAQAQQQ